MLLTDVVFPAYAAVLPLDAGLILRTIFWGGVCVVDPSKSFPEVFTVTVGVTTGVVSTGNTIVSPSFFQYPQNKTDVDSLDIGVCVVSGIEATATVALAWAVTLPFVIKNLLSVKLSTLVDWVSSILKASSPKAGFAILLSSNDGT